MIKKCMACGIEKNTSVLEVYPYPESDRLTDKPIPSLMVLEVVKSNYPDKSDWKMVVVCHHCFEKLDPDMWISDKCLESISCITPFQSLPNYVTRTEENTQSRWNPENY